MLAQAAATATASPMAVSQDYTGVFIGAGITLCVGIIAAITTLISGSLAHRRERKTERAREQRKQIERLLTVAQEAFRDCSTYRARVVKWIGTGEQIEAASALTLADEAQRIATLYVSECADEVHSFAFTVKNFSDWALICGERMLNADRDPEVLMDAASQEEFSIRIGEVQEKLICIANRCQQLMPALGGAKIIWKSRPPRG